MAEPLTLTAWAESDDGSRPVPVGNERLENPTEEAIRDAVGRLVESTDAPRLGIEYGAGPPLSIARHDVDAATRLIWSWAEKRTSTSL